MAPGERGKGRPMPATPVAARNLHANLHTDLHTRPRHPRTAASVCGQGCVKDTAAAERHLETGQKLQAAGRTLQAATAFTGEGIAAAAAAMA
eukprot:8036-Chlamydomonas_euryale.AAC.2